jgi:biotin-dependent carboxylase-like uncharacterized protein
MIEILEPGPLCTVQDLGRSGWAELGVGRAGAFDRGALALANRLVGNHPAAAGLEITLGGLRLRLSGAATVAVTGARCGGTLDWGRAVSLPAGSVLELHAPSEGLRTYLAVRGGLDAAPVLGSRSTDTLGGLGPAPLRAGDRLGIGASGAAGIDGSAAVPRPVPARLEVVLGPRADWFTGEAVALLVSARWTVRPESNRIGVRLDGPELPRMRAGELASEATVPGALQVPPDGRPILLGPDAPVTGGYPVIAVLRERDLDAAGQLRPGDRVQFR